MRTFKAVARKGGNLTGAGLHTATVLSATEVESKSGTEQLEIKLIAKDGTKRTAWFNLMGYKTNKKGQYIGADGKVIKYSLNDKPEMRKAAQAKRIEDETKTETCYRRIGEFACDCGIDPDSNWTADDLVDRNVLIGVEGVGTEARISNTFAITNAEYAQTFMSTRLGYDVVLDEAPVLEQEEV